MPRRRPILRYLSKKKEEANAKKKEEAKARKKEAVKAKNDITVKSAKVIQAAVVNSNKLHEESMSVEEAIIDPKVNNPEVVEVLSEKTPTRQRIRSTKRTTVKNPATSSKKTTVKKTTVKNPVTSSKKTTVKKTNTDS